MCCGGGDTTTTNKQSPWGPTKAPLKGAITDLGAWYAGPNPMYYPGDTVANFRPVQQNAFGQIIKSAASPNLAAAQGGYQGFATGGGAGSGLLNSAGSGYGAIAGGGGPGSAALGQAQQGWQGVASHGGVQGAGGLATLKGWANGSNIGKNPWLDDAFNQAADQVRGQTAGTFEQAGRYHSGAHEDVQERNQNRLATDLYGGAYDADVNRSLGAAQYLQGNALTGLGGLESTSGQAVQNALAGLGGQVGVAGQQAGNSMAGYNALAGVDAARIANLQQGANAGQFMQGQDQREMDANRQKYDWEQNAEAMKIQQYMQTLLGVGGQFGTTSATQPGVPWWQQALGYGLSGASVAAPFFK